MYFVCLYVSNCHVCLYFVCLYVSTKTTVNTDTQTSIHTNIQTYSTIGQSEIPDTSKVILVCMLEPISTIKHMPFGPNIHTYISIWACFCNTYISISSIFTVVLEDTIKQTSKTNCYVAMYVWMNAVNMHQKWVIPPKYMAM